MNTAFMSLLITLLHFVKGLSNSFSSCCMPTIQPVLAKLACCDYYRM